MSRLSTFACRGSAASMRFGNTKGNSDVRLLVLTMHREARGSCARRSWPVPDGYLLRRTWQGTACRRRWTRCLQEGVTYRRASPGRLRIAWAQRVHRRRHAPPRKIALGAVPNDWSSWNSLGRGDPVPTWIAVAGFQSQSAAVTSIGHDNEPKLDLKGSQGRLRGLAGQSPRASTQVASLT